MYYMCQNVTHFLLSKQDPDRGPAMLELIDVDVSRIGALGPIFGSVTRRAIWGNYGKSYFMGKYMGKLCVILWAYSEISVVLWENHGKIIGKPQENDGGLPSGKCLHNDGKSVFCFAELTIAIYCHGHVP